MDWIYIVNCYTNYCINYYLESNVLTFEIDEQDDTEWIAINPNEQKQ